MGASWARNHTASFDNFNSWWVKTVEKSVVKHVQNQDELGTYLKENLNEGGHSSFYSVVTRIVDHA